MHPAQKAFIIGSGVAGLSAAIRLAVQGFAVTVFEKNSYPGGKLSDFTHNNFHFDAGPSLFTQPQNMAELFELANENIEDYFKYKPVDTACRYFFEDGLVLDAYTKPEKLAEELSEKTGEPAEAIKKYLQASASAYSDIGEIFLNYSLHKKSTLRKIPIIKALSSVRKAYLFSSLNQYNKNSFSSPKLVQLFNRYATYNGSNPFKAPAMLSIIPHLEYNEGVFYPKGGMISITAALYELALKKGVLFEFNSPVQRIIVHENEARGIVVNQNNLFADVIISNTDTHFTYKYLLQDDLKVQKLLQQERSSSALIFYWGISKEFPELQLHNIFFSNNYAAEFEDIFKNKKLNSDPTVYINITSKCEPGIQAPVGKENWFVMVNAPANTNQNWALLIEKTKVNIISKLNRILKTDMEKYIETEDILDPVLIEQKTSSYQGSLYGTSSNSKMAAFLRHPNFNRKIRRLYFAGGSVHPGGGIPLCLKSSSIMCDIIAEDRVKWTHH